MSTRPGDSNTQHQSKRILGTGFSLAITIGGIIGLGIFYSRRNDSTEDFILAGHSLSTPVASGGRML